MCLRRDHKRTVRAPAKLNLYLEVLGRRADGFHELETLMVPIHLGDRVHMTALAPKADRDAAPIVLNLHGAWPLRSSPPAVIPADSSNLVVRALELLRQRSGCGMGARVDLLKRTPAAAGLGGGSSNAAAALRLANRLWQLNWGTDRLGELAAEVGSDVPFFLSRGAAICRGRGERVERLPPMKPLHFVIVKPPASLDTAEVYHAYDAQHPTASVQHSAASGHRFPSGSSLWAARWGELSRWVQNGLQMAAESLCPALKRLRVVFGQLDFLAHQVSGSGSAYFGICRHAQHARRLATVLRTRQLGLVYATRSYP